MKTEWVDKTDVARRQISAAVRLFFKQYDAIVIHTVIAAAHQVLVDVGMQKGIEGALKSTKRMEDAEMKDFLRGVNYPFNFFKHADRDHAAKINIGPLLEFTQDFIMDAVLMLQMITGSISI